MNYETWRATFQSSEQAARAAYQELQADTATDAYAVIEEGGKIGYTVMVHEDGIDPQQAEETARNFCHEHINDCAGNGVEGAGSWVVRPLTIGRIKRHIQPQAQERSGHE